MLNGPFAHPDPLISDAELERELNEHLGNSAAVQVVVELLEGLRELNLSWWTPAGRRAAVPAEQRMRDLVERPDIRQRVMQALTQMPPKASRRLDPSAQAVLLDAVLEEDVSVDAFEDAFRVQELVAYGDAGALFQQVVAALPWEQAGAAEREVLAIFMDSCLRERSFQGKALDPVLTWWELRQAIDPDAWQEYLPRDVRVGADRARLELERAEPGVVFTARHELESVGLATIREHLPLKYLAGIFDAAGLKMGVAVAAAPVPLGDAPATPEALPTIPADIRPLDDDLQYTIVGEVGRDDLGDAPDLVVADAPKEDPWGGNDQLTDPGLGGADLGIPAPTTAPRPDGGRRRARRVE